MNEKEQEALLSLPCHPIDYVRRRDIVPGGELLKSAILVSSGMVSRFAQSLIGVRQLTSIHLPGEIVNLHALVHVPEFGGMNALCDTATLHIPLAALRALASRYPAIAEAFWRDCMLAAGIARQWSVNIGLSDARTRLAHLLCEMAIRTGDDRSVSLAYALPLTQDQLAEATALTGVHVNRCLKTLSACVIVKVGKVQILDWNALVRAGAFDASYLLADLREDARRMATAA